ncbi:phage major capsid protein [Azospirillum palustre]
MASPNWSEAMTFTLDNRSKVLADNTSKANALLSRLKAKGKQKLVSGGLTIVQEIEYATNSSIKRYSGYEAVSINPSDVFTAAQFDYKQLAVAVSMSGLEQLQNSGPDALMDLMESRIANAEKTMTNTLAADVYSDGTADGGKQIGGLQLLVSDAGTGTVGGINSSTWAFWKSQFYSFSANSATASSTTIQSAMNQLYLNLSRGSDVPDLIVADASHFRYYLESLQAIQRITSSSEASAGYQSLKFMNADVVMDGGYFGSAPAAHMYMLNTDYIYYRPHRDRNMVTLGDGNRFSVNQDALVRLLGWAGNMTVSNRSLQGCIVA